LSDSHAHWKDGNAGHRHSYEQRNSLHGPSRSPQTKRSYGAQKETGYLTAGTATGALILAHDALIEDLTRKVTKGAHSLVAAVTRHAGPEVRSAVDLGVPYLNHERAFSGAFGASS
jgi:hypothetical protein